MLNSAPGALAANSHLPRAQELVESNIGNDRLALTLVLERVVQEEGPAIVSEGV